MAESAPENVRPIRCDATTVEVEARLLGAADDHAARLAAAAGSRSAVRIVGGDPDAVAEAAASEGVDCLLGDGLSLLVGPEPSVSATLARVGRSAQPTIGSEVAEGLFRTGVAIRHRTGILRRTRPLLLGVVNVTPDSFSDGGDAFALTAAVDRALALHAEGADVVDLGGESTRPGADPVSPDEELRRVLPVVERLAGRSDGPVISIDTRRADVAREALAAGASIVNDVTGCADEAMVETVARAGAAVIIGHIRGTPRTMQDDPRYADVMNEVHHDLARAVARARAAGVAADAILVDPGIGFGKRDRHNVELLARIGELRSIAPVCVGVSRKSFIGRLADVEDPRGRLPGSLAATVLAVARGASAVRAHDVAETRQALAIAGAILDWSRVTDPPPD